MDKNDSLAHEGLGSGSMPNMMMMMMYLHSEVSDYFLLQNFQLSGQKDDWWMVVAALATFALSFIYEFLKQIIRWCTECATKSDMVCLDHLYARATGANLNAASAVYSTPNEVGERWMTSSRNAYGSAEQTRVKRTASIDADNRAGNFLAVQANNHEHQRNNNINRVNNHVIPIARCLHLFQSVFYGLQLFLSYLLMLIAMTYSVWLLLAIVLGSTFGYFVFEWRNLRHITVQTSRSIAPVFPGVATRRV